MDHTFALLEERAIESLWFMGIANVGEGTADPLQNLVPLASQMGLLGEGSSDVDGFQIADSHLVL